MTARDEVNAAQVGGDIEKAPRDGRVEDKPSTTLREDVAAYGLEKVLARHGRVDLVPLVRSVGCRGRATVWRYRVLP